MSSSQSDPRFHIDSNWDYTYRLGLEFLKISFGIFCFIFKKAINFFDLFKTVSKKDVTGQIALVTGGANGLGRALSIEFAKAGCNIAIADIDETAANNLTKYLIDTYRIKAKSYKVDVAIFSEIQKLKENIEKDLGYVDIVVNNAGLLPHVQTLNPKLSAERIGKVIDVNLKSIIWTSKTFIGGMKERKKGHIVSICSVAGLVAGPYILDYPCSKAAVKAFMDCLHWDLIMSEDARFIKTTTIFPGFILTNDSMVNVMKATDTCRLIKPMMPAYVAENAVDAVLKNQRTLVIPWHLKYSSLLSLLPDGIAEKFIRNVFTINLDGLPLE